MSARTRRSHSRAPRSRRRTFARAARLTLSVTAMIDVVFLLLVYFMLVAQFRPRERAMPTDAAPQEIAEQTDPFSLPVTPIRIAVHSVSDSPNAYALASDSPYVQGFGTFAALTQGLTSLRGSLIDLDQRFIVVPEPGSRWEHALGAMNAIRQAGFTSVSFDKPNDAVIEANQ